MQYLYVRQKVADYSKWLEVFESHAEAQKEAGLRDLQLLRDVNEPNIVVCIFRVEDVEKARVFTSAPQATKARQDSGIIDTPEVLWLEKI